MSSANFYQNVSLKDALHRLDLLTTLYPPDSITVPVESLVPGRVLAEDIEADEDIPKIRTSTIDGVATMVNFPGTRRRIVGSSTALSSYDATILPGECVRIAIGGAVPNGANAVVPYRNGMSEEIDGAEHVNISLRMREGDNIREPGSEARKGDILIKDGSKIDSSVIALLSVLDIEEVEIYRKPRVCVMSIGKSEASRTRDRLLTLFRAQGFKSIDGGSIKNKLSAVEENIRTVAEFSCVIVITGEIEKVRNAMEKLKLQTVFTSINSNPGDFSVAKGSIDEKPVVTFAIPEDVNSAWIGANILISPLLRAMEGRVAKSALCFQSQTTAPIEESADIRFLTARTDTFDGNFVTTPSNFGYELKLNSIIEVPANKRLESGDLVNVFLVESTLSI